MTDAENELRRLADIAMQNPSMALEFAMKCGPTHVSDLLDRIEALEAALKCTHGEDRIYCDKALSASVEEAERKGAEEMRKDVFDVLYHRGFKEDAFGRETLERAMVEIDKLKPTGDAP